MFTRKAAFYFALATAILTLGLFFGDFQLGILVLGLGSLFFLANIWGLPDRVDVVLTRQIVPDETYGDEDVTVESHVRNMTDSTVVSLDVHEYLPSRIKPTKGTTQTIGSIGPRQDYNLIVNFPCPLRGNYKIGPLVVRARDPFGFYLVEKKLGAETLSVMPRPERILGGQLRPRHVRSRPGMIPSKSLGLGTEFFSARTYVPGDDPKRINWKASARRRQLIINETEADRVTDVMVVLDTDVNVFEPAEEELFEREIRAAASIGSLLLRQGNRVGLVLQGGERGSLPSGFGKVHQRRMLYLLADAKPGRSSVPTSYVMSQLAGRMHPSRAQIVLVSPLLDPEVKDGVTRLADAGYSMMVISPLPNRPPKFESVTQELAFDLAMLERSITLLALEKTSTVVNWPATVTLSVVMSKVRRQRPTFMA